jgi:hypothetical protein
MKEFKCLVTEFELFSAVRNWKSYWSLQIRPFLRGDILEVGAGIGSNTLILAAMALEMRQRQGCARVRRQS